MNAETYLELLRIAHMAAIGRGAPLTGGVRLGLGERIDDDMQFNTETGFQDTPGTYSVPSESRELNVFADAALAEMKVGLTRHELVDVLVNQFNVPRSNLVYAWDIPTHTVMRDGQRRPELEPEFFTGNPLDPASVTDYMQSSAYRPNNRWAGRQGKDVSGATVPTFIGGVSGSVAKYPDATGPMYEHTNPFTANSAVGWGIEAALGAALGPTALAAGKRLLGPLFRAMPQLPPAVLARFRGAAKPDVNQYIPSNPDAMGMPGQKPYNVADEGIENLIADQMAGLDEELVEKFLPSNEVLEWDDEMTEAITNISANINKHFEEFAAGAADLPTAGEIELVEDITRFLTDMTPEGQQRIREEIFKRRLGLSPTGDYSGMGLWEEVDQIKSQLPPFDSTRGGFRPRNEPTGTTGKDIDVRGDGAGQGGGQGGGPPDAPPAAGFPDDEIPGPNEAWDPHPPWMEEGLEGPPGTPAIDYGAVPIGHPDHPRRHLRRDDDLIDRYPEGYMAEDFIMNEPKVFDPETSAIERKFRAGEFTRDEADALLEGLERIRIFPNAPGRQELLEGPPGTPASGRAHHEEGWPAAGGPRSVENDPGWVGDFHPDYDDSWMTLADVAEIREVSPLGVTDEMLADAVEKGMIEQANADGLQAELRERKRIVLEGLEGPPGTPEGSQWTATPKGRYAHPFGSADNPFPEHWSQTRRDMWGQDPNWDAPPPTNPRINTDLVQTPYGQWVTPDEFNRRAKAYKEINPDHAGVMDRSTGEFMSPTESARRQGTLSSWDQILGEPDPSPLSFKDALKSLGTGAAAAGATAVTAQTLFPEQVEKVVSGLAKFHDGWWSWIKEFPEHLDWVVRATGATLDGMEQGTRSTGNPVLDGLSDGFREEAGAWMGSMGGGAVPVVGRQDAVMLKTLSKDLSEQGHNGNAMFPNDIRREIENGDAMIVGYRSDADYKRAVEQSGEYGIEVDRHFWRKPNRKNIRPAEGQPWTSDHLKKLATTNYFYPDAGARRGQR